MQTNWFVVTGGPSSGKTTVLKELQKKGHVTFEEAARLVIDEGVASGETVADIRSDEKNFQELVLKRKLAIERGHNKKRLSFFDRGVHDTAAYYAFYKWELSRQLKTAMQNASYRTVFLLELLPHFEKDYARTEDKKFAKKLQSLLRQAYAAYGVPVIEVPVMSPKKRTQFILDKVANVSGRQL